MEPRPIFLKVMFRNVLMILSVDFFVQAPLTITGEGFFRIRIRILFLSGRIIRSSLLEFGQHSDMRFSDPQLVLGKHGLNLNFLGAGQFGHFEQVGLPAHDNIFKAEEVEGAPFSDGFEDEGRQIPRLEDVKNIMALIPRLFGLLVGRGVLGDLFAKSSHDQLALWYLFDEWRLDIDHNVPSENFNNFNYPKLDINKLKLNYSIYLETCQNLSVHFSIPFPSLLSCFFIKLPALKKPLASCQWLDNIRLSSLHLKPNPYSFIKMSIFLNLVINNSNQTQELLTPYIR